MSPATRDPNYPQPGFLTRLAAFMTSNIQSPNPAGSIVLQELLQGSQQVASFLLVSHVSTGAALLSILPGVPSAAHSALPVYIIYIYIYIYIHTHLSHARCDLQLQILVQALVSLTHAGHARPIATSRVKHGLLRQGVVLLQDLDSARTFKDEAKIESAHFGESELENRSFSRRWLGSSKTVDLDDCAD